MRLLAIPLTILSVLVLATLACTSDREWSPAEDEPTPFTEDNRAINDQAEEAGQERADAWNTLKRQARNPQDGVGTSHESVGDSPQLYLRNDHGEYTRITTADYIRDELNFRSRAPIPGNDPRGDIAAILRERAVLTPPEGAILIPGRRSLADAVHNLFR